MKNHYSLIVITIFISYTSIRCVENKTTPLDTTMNSREIQDYKTDPTIDLGTKAFLNVLNAPGGKPLETLSPTAARMVLSEAQSSVVVDLSGTEQAEKVIPAAGHSVKLIIVRPAGLRGDLPVFMFIHGGGWVLGDFPTHQRLIRDLVVASGFAAVYVDYSRSPEAKYPVAVNEIYAATSWVAENGAEIGVDGKNLAIVGNSVGGNMSAVTSLMAKKNNGPKIKLQILMWPIVDTDFETPTYKLYGKDRFLTTSLMKWMYNQYTTNLSQRKEIYASPLLASIDELKGLPETLIMTAENDVLRAEGEAFGRKLDLAGVKVTTVRYNGTIHDFGLLNGLAELSATKSMIAQSAAALHSALK